MQSNGTVNGCTVFYFFTGSFFGVWVDFLLISVFQMQILGTIQYLQEVKKQYFSFHRK